MSILVTTRRYLSCLPLVLAIQAPVFAAETRIEAGDTIYEGSYSVDTKSGLIGGNGSIQWSDGKYYEGQVAASQPNGQGNINWPNGDSYEGPFVSGTPHGFGIYRWKNGDSFTGEFVKGMRNGQGVFTWENGDRWEGIFANNNLTDQGRMIRKQAPETQSPVRTENAVASSAAVATAPPAPVRDIPPATAPAKTVTAVRSTPAARKGPGIYSYDYVMQDGETSAKVFYGRGFVSLAAPHIAELHRRENEIVDNNRRNAASSVSADSGSSKSSGSQRWKCSFVCQGSWFAKGETPTIEATVWAGNSELDAKDALKRDAGKYCSKYAVSGALGKENMTPGRVWCKKD